MFDSLRADFIFAWRQLNKRRVTSLAAVLSLGLGIGACTAAFTIVDALFFHALPIAHPERLYALNQPKPAGNFTYAQFRGMRASVQDQADLIAVSGAPSLDIAFDSSQELEPIHGQFVSGWMFSDFGLHPALGRLLTVNDDLTPGASPVAVLSYDYWTRRFARDPNVIGRTLRIGPDWRTGESPKVFEIAGVAPQGFTGTETGVAIDIFLPTMMQAMVENPVASIFRVFAYVHPGAEINPVRDRLLATLNRERPQDHTALLVESAAAGASDLRTGYAQPLAALSIMAALVLLIACANVANLLKAQTAARSREIAVRTAVGATRGRIFQMVLVESSIHAFLAAAAGALFALWAGPFVIGRINPPDNPARLSLTLDWRVAAFSLALIVASTLLFGAGPAVYASRQATKALKGSGTAVATAVQAAFCFLVLFLAGLFLTSFERLSSQPTGIAANGLLNLNITTTQPREPPVLWDQITARLRGLPGIETAAYADWPVLDGNGYKTTDISINGAPPNGVTAWNMNVSPGWIGALGIPLLAGRDLLPSDPPGAVIVNEEFAKAFFNAENPVGKTFQFTWSAFAGRTLTVVGLARNARYRFLRQEMLPVAYTNFRDGRGLLQGGTIVVRTASANPSALASNPLSLAALLRQEVSRANPDFRVSSVQSQQSLIDHQTLRDRLLALLASFFAAVALLLAGVGLYGVLDYSVFQRRREIGIRMAVGARASHIIRGVTLGILMWVLAGSAAGLALGIASARYLASLLYQVKPTDASSLAIPALALLAAAILAALPPVLRAIRVDPVEVLRAE